MAQDFFAAFGHDGIGTVGNDTTIASADIEGVSFIAIQALEKRTSNLQAENNELKYQNDLLQQELKALQNDLHVVINKIKYLELDRAHQNETVTAETSTK